MNFWEEMCILFIVLQFLTHGEEHQDDCTCSYMFCADYALNNLFQRSHIGSKGMGVHKWPNDRGPTIL